MTLATVIPVGLVSFPPPKVSKPDFVSTLVLPTIMVADASGAPTHSNTVCTTS